MSGDRAVQIAQQLEQDILSGKLHPGERLPPERDLVEKLGVSRSVVREALNRLQSVGLVRSVQGSGTRVSEPDDRPLVVGYRRLMQLGKIRPQDLSAVRLPLETTIASLAAERRSDKHLEQLAKTLAVLGSSASTLEQRVEADLDFHACLAEASGNPIFHIILHPIYELLRETREMTIGTFGADSALHHHTQILSAVRDRDSLRAVAAMREHLQASQEHLVQLAEQPGA